MKILLYEWNGIMQRDILQSLRGMDVEVVRMSYEMVDLAQDDYFYDRLKKRLLSQYFDAVLSVHFFPVIADVCHEIGATYISWIYDSPFLCPRWETLYYEEVKAFIFDKKLADSLQKEGYSVQYEPLAVNVKRLNQIALSQTDIVSYGADASFVGQLYRVVKQNGDSVEQKKNETFLDRVHSIQTLSELCSVRLYSKDVDNKEIPDAKQMGTVMYYSEMPKVFKASKLNLNVTLKTIESGIPLRVLDIMGAGGFLISNMQPEFSDYFQVGRELETYATMEELRDKAKYYLSHEEDRLQIANEGRKKMEQEFSYEVRIKSLFQKADLFL